VRFRVYLLRHHGRRLPWREVLNGRSVVGELITSVRIVGQARFLVASLMPLQEAIGGPLVPDLYEPVLTAVAPLAMRLRGIEQWEGCGVVQEWHCEVP